MAVQHRLRGSVHISHAAFQTLTALHTPPPLRSPTDPRHLRPYASSWSYDSHSQSFRFDLQGELESQDVEVFLILLADLIDDDEIATLHHSADLDEAELCLVRASRIGSAPADGDPPEPSELVRETDWEQVGPMLATIAIDENWLRCTTLRGRRFTVYIPELRRIMHLEPDPPARVAWFGAEVEFGGARVPATIDSWTLFNRREPDDELDYHDIDHHATALELRGRLRLSPGTLRELESSYPPDCPLRQRAKQWAWSEALGSLDLHLCELTRKRAQAFLDRAAMLKELPLIDRLTVRHRGSEGLYLVDSGRRAWVPSQWVPHPDAREGGRRVAGSLVDVDAWKPSDGTFSF